MANARRSLRRLVQQYRSCHCPVSYPQSEAVKIESPCLLQLAVVSQSAVLQRCAVSCAPSSGCLAPSRPQLFDLDRSERQPERIVIEFMSRISSAKPRLLPTLSAKAAEQRPTGKDELHGKSSSQRIPLSSSYLTHRHFLLHLQITSPSPPMKPLLISALLALPLAVLGSPHHLRPRQTLTATGDACPGDDSTSDQSCDSGFCSAGVCTDPSATTGIADGGHCVSDSNCNSGSVSNVLLCV